MKCRSEWSKVLGLCLGLGCLLGGVTAGQAQTASDGKPPDGGEERVVVAGEPTEAVVAAKPSEGTVPRWVRFSGLVREKDAGGEVGSSAPHRDVVGITFALYKEQEGGAPLWMEVQNVKLNTQGRYTVLLGATHPEGLPMDIFSSAEAQWLGVQVEGQEEQPRVLLVSVPYALKAAEAETLGGKSVSEFVLAKPSKQDQPFTQDATTAGENSQQASGIPVTAYVTTNNFIPKFINCGISCQVDDSVMSQSGGNIGVGGNLGIGTNSPARSLHISSTAPVIRLQDTNVASNFWELQQSAFSLDTFGFLRYDNGVVAQEKSFFITPAGNVGLGTASPQRKLHVRSSAPVIRLEDTNLPNSFWELQQSAFNFDTFGFLRYESGVAVEGKSFVVTNAGRMGVGLANPAQKLSVAGVVESTSGGFKFPNGSIQTAAVVDTNSGGTVTSVAAGTGLIASPAPILGAGTLSIDTAVVPRLNAANTFTANQIISNARLGVGTASPDAGVLLHVKNFADNGGRIRVGGNQVDTSGAIRRISIGDGDFIYLGEAPTVDDTLEIRGTRVHMITTLMGINVASPTNILTVQQGSSTDPIADAWTVYSSRRWKKNIQTLDHALAKVERLRGVSYESKLESKPEIGLIAEEVGEVIPELVTYEENGTDATSVDYARLTALLVEAVKEQQEQIRNLKTELGTRAQEYRELRAQMQRLKAASQSRTVHKRSDDAVTGGR